MNLTPKTPSEDIASERYLQEETPLHSGWSGKPLSESASRYSRYSSKFLSHVLVNSYIFLVYRQIG